MDRGEAHGHLRLNRYRPDDLQVLGTLDRVVEQHRLPHSGLRAEASAPLIPARTLSSTSWSTCFSAWRSINSTRRPYR